MEWVISIRTAIDYMEKHLLEDLTIEQIANVALVSPFYFQKGFSMLSGITVSEYLRNRRLTLAGNELMSTDIKIIDLALKYGYDSPDSFTKAFTRFHSVTPTAVRKDGATIKTFAPLKINFSLKGGYIMDYKIVEKPELKFVGVSNTFKYENAFIEVPKHWQNVMSKYAPNICGMFGINRDKDMGCNNFEYIIADIYDEKKAKIEGIQTFTVPAFKWAIFPCIGQCVKVMQETNKKIFSEWLPNNETYKIADGYCIEMYSDARNFANGINDDKYYSELWIPVIEK